MKKISAFFTLAVITAIMLFASGFSVSAQNTGPYTLTFKDYDGSVISENSNYHTGDDIVYPATPKRSSNSTYTYPFEKWTLISTQTQDFEDDNYFGDSTTVGAFFKETDKNNVYSGSASLGLITDEKIGTASNRFIINKENTLINAFGSEAIDLTLTFKYKLTKGSANFYLNVGGMSNNAWAIQKEIIDYKSYNLGEPKNSWQTFSCDFKLNGKSYFQSVSENVYKDQAKHLIALFGATAGTELYIDDVTIACKGDVTYIATYKKTYIDYTVTFKNYDDTVISSKTYHYGDTVEIPDDPTRASDANYYYNFARWNKTPAEKCTGNQTYIAKYSSKLKYKNADGTTLFKEPDGRYSYRKNTMFKNETTLCKYYNTWYYVQNGYVNFNATTLCKYGNTWYYVQNGKVNFGATTLCKYGNTWYYVQNGKVNFGATTLCKYGNTWYYVQRGQVNFAATTLCKYGNTWYYVQKGQVNFAATLRFKYYGTYYNVVKGVVKF